MLIPIYYGKRFAFSLIAERCAQTICPRCNHAWQMIDRVGAVGHGFSILGLRNEHADNAARQQAIKALGKSAFELSPVACPKCGEFHPNMKPILRWLLGQRILFAGMGTAVILAVGALVAFLRVEMSQRLLLAAMGLAAVAFLATRYWLDLRLSPVTIEDLPSAVGRPPVSGITLSRRAGLGLA